MEQLPGTLWIARMDSGVSTGWWCDKHKKHIVPVVVARSLPKGMELTEACLDCFYEDTGILENEDLEFTAKPKFTEEEMSEVIVIDFDKAKEQLALPPAENTCEESGCQFEQAGECMKCGRGVCYSHLVPPGYVCVSCKLAENNPQEPDDDFEAELTAEDGVFDA